MHAQAACVLMETVNTDAFSHINVKCFENRNVYLASSNVGIYDIGQPKFYGKGSTGNRETSAYLT